MVKNKKLISMSLSELFSSLTINRSISKSIQTISKMNSSKMYEENFNVIMELPIIKNLVHKNSDLKKEIRILKKLLFSIPCSQCNKKKSNKKSVKDIRNSNRKFIVSNETKQEVVEKDNEIVDVDVEDDDIEIVLVKKRKKGKYSIRN